MERYVVTIGNPGVDHYYRSENWPRLGDKARVHYIESLVGGMIPNAGCILATYGLPTHLISQVGDDKWLAVLQDDLAAYGLGLNYWTVEPGMANNENFIMLSENEKTIFLVQNEKPVFRLTEEQHRLLDGAAYVYTTIADFKRFDGWADRLERLVERGVGLFLDVESEAFTDAVTDRPFFEAATIISMNEHAFDKFRSGPGGDEGWQRLLRGGDKIVAITKGADGCDVFYDGGRIEEAAWPVTPVDTTGAGDTFNASLLFGHLQGWTLRETVRFAGAAAARSITAVGPKTGAVSVDVVLQFMNAQAP